MQEASALRQNPPGSLLAAFLFHMEGGIVIPPYFQFHIHQADPVALDAAVPTGVRALHHNALAQLFGQARGLPAREGAHQGSRPAQLKVEEVQARPLLVAGHHADAALQVPGGEGGFADVDDVHIEHGLPIVRQLQRGRQEPFDARVGNAKQIEALLAVHRPAVHEPRQLLRRYKVTGLHA